MKSEVRATKVVHVAVAVIRDCENRILIAKRPSDKHMGGYWEFPGGKLEEGETVEKALKREILEEVNLTINAKSPLIQIPWYYPEKSVYLDVINCELVAGVAEGCEGQEIQWVEAEKLGLYRFPPANKSILNAITLPECMLVTGEAADENEFLCKLETAISKGISLIQLRGLENFDSAFLLREVANRYGDNGDLAFFLNLEPETALEYGYKNLHLKSKSLNSIQSAKEISHFSRVSAAVHNEDELEKANSLELDFIVVSPVKRTKTHPDAKPLAMSQLQKLVNEAQMPVFGLGGLDSEDLQELKAVGAHGVAAVSAFWDF